MGLSKRLFEFVDYHIRGDGECNGIVLKAWADKHGLDEDDRLRLCFFFAVTYCVESAIAMFNEKEQIGGEWARSNKDRLIFQSDRKYVRMRNTFQTLLEFYESAFEDIRAVADGPAIDLEKQIPAVERWPFFGRFSAYLFLETAAWLTGKEILNAEMEWENGQTATSGLLNLYGLDRAADAFDKTGRLPKGLTQGKMQAMAAPVLTAIQSAGGNPNITMVETSLCAYRKFFKGSRYNGYYLDRMLEEIHAMAREYPWISNELIQLRMQLFDHKYLGEVMGWKGIRKDKKKLYREQGIIE